MHVVMILILAVENHFNKPRHGNSKEPRELKIHDDKVLPQIISTSSSYLYNGKLSVKINTQNSFICLNTLCVNLFIRSHDYDAKCSLVR